MNVTELCRKNLYNRLGIDDRPKRSTLEVEVEIHRMNRKLDEVVSLARPRLIMGGMRYGSRATHEQLMNYMQTKLDKFKADGNFEMLVDLFNLCVVEGELKTHPKFHFKGEDRE